MEINLYGGDKPDGEVLQWGHAFYSVEILVSPGQPVFDFAASMGPRFLQRGNEPADDIDIDLILLQWGHAFYSVEILRFQC